MAADSVGKISLDIDLVSKSLNKQINNIGNNVAKSISGSIQSSLSRSMNSVESSLNRFQSSLSGTMKKIGAIFGAFALGSFAKNVSNAAIEVEASLGQIERLMGSSAVSFEKWANTQAKAFNMSRSEAIQYGAVFGNLISSFSNSTAQTAQYTQDLLKTASVVASGTGRTMSDVLERIRSGLLGNTEAIEDLGINVNIAMIESTRAFQQFANGRSWEQLDFQTQQLIRYFAILEQASTKFGDAVANNTASRLSQFNAILSNIRLNLGNAFLPLLNAVLPALTAFAAKVESITAKIAQFFQVLFGKSAVKQTKTQTQTIAQQSAEVGGLNTALGNTAKATEKVSKAQKKVFKSLAGFDEITNIKTSVDTGPSDSGSAGGVSSGGGATTISAPGIDTTEFDNGANTISQRVIDLANKVRTAFQNMATFIKKYNNEIIASLSGLAAALMTYKLITNWGKAVTGLRKAFDGLKGIFTGISLPALAFAAVIGLLVGALVYLWRTNEDFRNKVTEIWNAIKEAVGIAIQAVVNFVKEMADKIIVFWQENGTQILQAVQNVFNGILAVIQFIMPFVLSIIKSVWENIKGVINGALEIIMGTIKIFTGLFTGDFSKMWEGIKQLFQGALEFVWNLVNLMFIGKILGGVKSFINGGKALFKSFVDAVKGTFKDFFNNLVLLFNYFKSTGSSIWKAIVSTIKNIVSAFVSAVKSNFNGLVNSAKSIFNGIKSAISTPFNWIKTNVTNVVKSMSNTVKSLFSDISNSAKSVFNGLKSIIVNPFNWIKSRVSSIVNGLSNTVKNVFSGMVSGIKSPINAFIDGFNALIRGLNKFKIDIPSWVPIMGGKKFGFDIPTIPKLAKGGIIDQPTLAWVGEAGKEVVMPLEHNTQWISQLANKIASLIPQTPQQTSFVANDRPLEVVLQVGQTKLARTVIKSINQLQRQEGRVLLEL